MKQIDICVVSTLHWYYELIIKHSFAGWKDVYPPILIQRGEKSYLVELQVEDNIIGKRDTKTDFRGVRHKLYRSGY